MHYSILFQFPLFHSPMPFVAGKWVEEPVFQSDKSVSSPIIAAQNPSPVGNSKSGYVADPNSPGLLCKRPMSTSSRLIIPFESFSSTGITGEFRTRIPSELIPLGIRESDWLSFVSKIENVQKEKGGSCFISFLLAVLIVTIPILISKCLAYQRSIGEVLDEFNQTVLRPKGLLAKFQSNEVHSKDYNEIINWLAISLTREDALALDQECAFYQPACCSKDIQPNKCQESCCGVCCGVKIIVSR
jgi:hypothetical protein